MSTSVSIPLDNMHLNLGGSITIDTTPIETSTKLTGDVNQPIATRISGDAANPIATLITGDANKPVTITTNLQGNPDKPIATSSSLEILNLPRFTLADIKDLATPKIRIRFPNYTQLCFKLLGTEIFSICMAGEAQTITEPYVPNAHERCEITCCEPDTRPFPMQNNRDNVANSPAKK
ncbi:MAG: hypothetical protein ABI472_11165 [Ginsengibacter sp.]